MLSPLSYAAMGKRKEKKKHVLLHKRVFALNANTWTCAWKRLFVSTAYKIQLYFVTKHVCG